MGKHAKIESLEITWPSGQANGLTDVRMDRTIAIKKKGWDCLAPASEGAKPLRYERSATAFSRIYACGFRQHAARCANNSALAVAAVPADSGYWPGFPRGLSGYVCRRSQRGPSDNPQCLGRHRTQAVHH